MYLSSKFLFSLPLQLFKKFLHPLICFWAFQRSSFMIASFPIYNNILNSDVKIVVALCLISVDAEDHRNSALQLNLFANSFTEGEYNFYSSNNIEIVSWYFASRNCIAYLLCINTVWYPVHRLVDMVTRIFADPIWSAVKCTGIINPVFLLVLWQVLIFNTSYVRKLQGWW